MEKEFLKKCVEEGLSLSQISKLSDKSITTIQYWLKKFDLKTNFLSFKDKGIIEYGDTRCCPRCETNKPLIEFYSRRGKEGGSVYCKQCTSNQALERQRALKEQLVNYKGGSCIRCGYDRYQGALEFHHIDPNEKDFTIAHLKLTTFNDKIKKELDKCILVCANCHREIHGEIKLLYYQY